MRKGAVLWVQYLCATDTRASEPLLFMVVGHGGSDGGCMATVVDIEVPWWPSLLICGDCGGLGILAVAEVVRVDVVVIAIAIIHGGC